jgi:hypothetical protein
LDNSGNKNLDQLNKNLDHENEIDDNTTISNDVPNATNIDNLGDDYEQKSLHFDIYDPRN